MIVADPEKAAKTQYGVRDFAAHLVYHHALDRSDLAIVGAIHCSSFDLIAANKGSGFSRFCNHGFSSLVRTCNMRSHELFRQSKERPKLGRDLSSIRTV